MGAFVRYWLVRIFDFFAPLKGPVDEGGGFFAIRKFFSEAQTHEFLRKLGPRKRLLLRRSDVAAIARAPAVQKAVRAYLGPFSVLDHAMIWVAPAQSNSGAWHHDSVGHRLKVFVVLHHGSPQIGTSIIPNTHRLRHESYASERMNHITTECPPLPLETGDLLIFDTNSLHKGNYGAAEHDRVVLQLEFSNLFKGLLTPGKIGILRRQSDLTV